MLAGPLVFLLAGRLYEQACGPTSRPYPDQLWRNPAPSVQTKAAKAAAKAASKQRRAQLWQAFQMQRARKTRSCCPYMIGAFVAVVALSVAAGILIGGQ